MNQENQLTQPTTSQETPPAAPPAQVRARRPFVAVVLMGFFLGTALLTFVYRTTFAATPVDADADSAPAQQPTFPRVSEKMQTDLAAALEPDLQWTTTAIHDPFVDREGYGGTKMSAPVASAAPVSTLPVAVPSSSVTMTQGPSAPSPAQIAEKERAVLSAARARIKGHEYEPAAYGYKEVLPVGITGRGRTRDVLLYGIPSKKYFSAAVGQQLMDATISSITPDGVVFATSSGQVSISWAHVNQKSNDVPEMRTGAVSDPAVPSEKIEPLRMPRSPNQRRGGPSSGQQYADLQYAVRDRYPHAQ